MEEIFTVTEYNKVIPAFMKAMKPYITGAMGYSVQIKAILDMS